MEFLEALAPLARFTEAPVVIFLGIFIRLSAFVFFLPGLGEVAVPARIRLAVALGVALVLVPAVLARPLTAPAEPAGIVLMLIAEAMSGAVIGFSIRVAAQALQIAGVMIAQSLSLAHAFGASFDGAPEPAMASLLIVSGTALALASGLHFHAVNALALSYDVLPFGAFPGASDSGRWAADRAAFAFSTALALSLPFVAMAFIYNLAIGAANRAMPQLSVAFVGAPGITLASLVLTAVVAGPILSAWLKIVQRSIRTLYGDGG